MTPHHRRRLGARRPLAHHLLALSHRPTAILGSTDWPQRNTRLPHFGGLGKTAPQARSEATRQKNLYAARESLPHPLATGPTD